MIDFIKIFEKLPGNFLVLMPDAKFTMLYASDSHLRNIKMNLSDLKEKGIFDVFPDVSGNLITVKQCLEEVVITKKSCKPPKLRYDIPINDSDKFEERYCREITPRCECPPRSSRPER